MQTPRNTSFNSVDSAIFGIHRLLIISFVILTLYFAKEIIIPFIIAALLTFLLSPLVTRLEKWLGGTASCLLVIVVAFSTIGVGIYVFARQLIQFGSNLKNYNDNIMKKLDALHLPQWRIFDELGEYLGSLKAKFLGFSSNSELSADVIPQNLNLIDISSTFLYLIELFLSSFFSILGTLGIVFILVIFMMLNRDDILKRIVKLFGPKISSTTSAINHAGTRVFNYLFRQFLVNLGYGFCVTIGLFLIGIPNAFLWGTFAAVFRFVPYIGVWVASIVPIALSFIVTDTWLVPLLTILLFCFLEFTTGYVVEPYFYGEVTGVSPFALIVAAIFWTWFWGPIGLLLSTPLTVCLVVLGQHVPNVKFLSILLSQEKH